MNTYSDWRGMVPKGHEVCPACGARERISRDHPEGLELGCRYCDALVVLPANDFAVRRMFGKLAQASEARRKRMVLFLDFDGVTHPQFPSKDYPDAENQRFAFMPRIESVLRDFPDVDVVIASSWREHHSLAELKDFFAPDIAERIVGATPIERTNFAHGTFSERGRRSSEARMWLVEHARGNAPWIALEDDEWSYLADDPVVLCDDGFRDTEEAALRTALQGMQRRLS
ncbi:MAG: HAD domain-containing protein [Sulfuricaulis sp.]